MHVGVLGGGLQGCCTALALAERGVSVTLFDRNHVLLSRTAVANEGKVHLGYMYVGDPSLATARTMMQGALAFAPFIARHLGSSTPALMTSLPTAYAVHRDSQHSAEEVSAYLANVHRLIGEAVKGREFHYFGNELSTAPRGWSRTERNAAFDPGVVTAVFDTPEVAINPVALARGIEVRIRSHPLIETRLNRNVSGVNFAGKSVRVASEELDDPLEEPFDHVVNALWEGRLVIDAMMGLKPKGPWLHRLKYGVTFTLPPQVRHLPSATVVSGPFGEMVSFRDGLTYMTWYPECLQGMSADMTPPDWETYPKEPLRSQILKGTIQAISNLVPGLRAVGAADLPDVCVKGGVIVAWGETDIYDPGSELHRRYEIGVTSAGRYHSIDPGKLTMAPFFAEQCAQRIIASAA